MKINEIMSATSVPWNWTYSSERQATAEFTVGDVQYEFKAKNSEYDHIDADRDMVGYDDEADENEEVDYRGYWEISFTGNGKTNMMRTGNAAQVISAITDIIKEFLVKYNKKIRVIEYDVQGSSGRSGVYGRIFSRLLPNWTKEDGSLHDVEIRRPS
jgi:ethanolamine ammonia-lyase large subunit